MFSTYEINIANGLAFPLVNALQQELSSQITSMAGFIRYTGITSPDEGIIWFEYTFDTLDQAEAAVSLERDWATNSSYVKEKADYLGSVVATRNFVNENQCQANQGSFGGLVTFEMTKSANITQ